MIGFLRGKIAGYNENMLLMDVGGVGYEVIISAGTAEELPPVGEELKIFTHLSVREDAMTLYGFLTSDDLSIFKQLIGVSGIGPKGAQSILSELSPDNLRFAILAGDAKAISKAPGIGAKTAQRIIIDLKDKLSLEETFEHALGQPEVKSKADHGQSSEAKDEAVEALIALGYSSTDAYRAVKNADDGSGMDANGLLKAALKFII